MATRFRLPSSTAAPAVSPALQSYTHDAPATLRRQLLTADTSALTGFAYTPDAADHLAAGDSLHTQFVGNPMAAGVTFTQNDVIKMAMRCKEPNSGCNMFLQLYAAIVSEDGATVRRVIRSKVADDLEIRSDANIIRFFSTTQDGADYTTVAGDRLVVELSATGTPTNVTGTQGHNSTIFLGSAGAGGDAPEDDTEAGATFNPWVEFVPSATFTSSVSVSGALSSAGALRWQAATFYGGSTASAGALVKSVVLTLAGVVASAGVGSWTAGKLLSGALTPVGTLALSATLTLAGALATVGTTAWTVGKSLSGSVASSGAVTFAYALVLFLAGTLTSAGVVSWSVGKRLAGTLAPVGTLVKRIAVYFAGILAMAGRLRFGRRGGVGAHAFALSTVGTDAGPAGSTGAEAGSAGHVGTGNE